MSRPSLSGILAVNKPAGITSRKVVDRVQHLVRPAKAGHAGTLDPLATGVLVVCIGAATRLISFVQEQRKTYRAAFLLGRTSDTDDVTGQVIETPVLETPEEPALRAALARFVGRILQTPPKFSAVHVGGKRAYDLARRGEDVQLAAREVDVYRIDLQHYAWPELRIEIECGSGTYIRSIGRDLGQALGCGAVMSELERTAIGPFDVGSSLSFESLDAETLRTRIRPTVDAVLHLPQFTISHVGEADLRQGRPISVGGLAVSDVPIACLNDSGRLIAVCDCRAASGRLHPRIVLPE